jgi:hypothetical protein
MAKMLTKVALKRTRAMLMNQSTLLHTTSPRSGPTAHCFLRRACGLEKSAAARSSGPASTSATRSRVCTDGRQKNEGTIDGPGEPRDHR